MRAVQYDQAAGTRPTQRAVGWEASDPFRANGGRRRRSDRSRQAIEAALLFAFRSLCVSQHDLMRFPNLAFSKPRLRFSDYNHSATHIQHVGGQHSLLVEIEKLHGPQRCSSRMFTHSDHEFTPDNSVFNRKLGIPCRDKRKVSNVSDSGPASLFLVHRSGN